MTLRALIFDVDGTLAETEEYHRRAFNRAFAEEGLDWYWDEALYRALLKVTGGRERILHFMAQHAPEKSAGGAEVLARHLHARKTEIYLAHMAGEGIPLRAGMAALIEEAQAHGLRLAIATTTSPANVEALMGKSLGAGWRTLFPVVMAGDMVARKKPAPDVYEAALNALDLPASACIALEDSANGTTSAKSAGLRVVAVRSPYLPEDDLSGADLVLDDSRVLDLALLEALDAACFPRINRN